MAETLSLFSPTLGGPLGLRYQAGFISPAEEQGLIAHVRDLPLAPFQFGAYEGKRRVSSFGWRYDYGERKLRKVCSPWSSSSSTTCEEVLPDSETSSHPAGMVVTETSPIKEASGSAHRQVS